MLTFVIPLYLACRKLLKTFNPRYNVLIFFFSDCYMHAVNRLYQYRKSISTKPFNARGSKVVRCQQCLLAEANCICHLSHTVESRAGFVLLMHDIEILKPSNTGRLIADVINDTYAFLWSRTEPDAKLLKLLSDPKWQPIVVFPEEYAYPTQELYQLKEPCKMNKRPLFILLDANWRDAKKMFKKSPYLADLPLLSIDTENLKTTYQLRNAVMSHQLSTAEVAAQALSYIMEDKHAELLEHWFDVFNYSYQKSVCQKNKGNPKAVEQYLAYIKKFC